MKFESVVQKEYETTKRVQPPQETVQVGDEVLIYSYLFCISLV